MKNHPYLRAYMAGVLLPSWFLLIVLAAFLAAHVTLRLPARVESAFVFPMALVPNLWGVWNVLYLRLRLKGRVSIGAFGSLLPLLLVPAGIGMAALLGLDFYTARQAALLLPAAMAIYFLAWKHGVGFFNRVVERI
jgi:hypothetical protein